MSDADRILWREDDVELREPTASEVEQVVGEAIAQSGDEAWIAALQAQGEIPRIPR